MMEYKNYLIFDFGASNGRVLVGRFNGERISFIETHRFENRPVYAAGTLYWDILRLYSELKIGVQTSLKKYSDMTSMAIDSWGVDFGLIDKNGNLMSNPVHYRDEKRAKSVDELYKVISIRDVFSMTGGQLTSEVSLFHMYSLKLKSATELFSANNFLMIPDLFNYFLTGEKSNEFTNATTTLMFDQKNKKWSDKLLNMLSIPQKIFCEIIQPGNKIGKLLNSVSKELEIHPIEVIAPCSHDTASAVTGIPVADTSKDWAFISMGTWCIIGIETENIIIKEEIVGTGFFNEGCAEGLNLFVKDINGLWVIQQCRERWSKEKGKVISWDEIVKLSSKTRPFMSFINIDNRVFCEPQVDMPEKIKKYCKKTGQKIPEDIGEISRCVYASLALRFRYDLEILEKFIYKKIEFFHLVGGGSANKLLCQWTANATGLPVIAGPEETTSVGNLIIQLKGTGEIKSLEEGRQISLLSSNVIGFEPKEEDIWSEAYDRYLRLFR